MAELKARFSLIDEMSEKLTSIADKGQTVMDRWEQAGDAASSAIDNVTSSASKSTSSIDGVVSSMDDLNSSINATGSAAGVFTSSVEDAASAIDELSSSTDSTDSSAESLSSTLDNLGTSIENAASETDNWTKAAGTYNKQALEMLYSTEELVEQGYKTVDALYLESERFMECESSIEKLNEGIESSSTLHHELLDSVEKTNESIEELSKSSEITVESQKELERASESLSQALSELESAENDAKKALADFDYLVDEGSVHIEDYENAANKATEALKKLEDAQKNASNATKDYSDAAGKAAENAGESGEKGVDAITAISETIIAAKIAEKTLEMAKAAYELADAYSEAEKIVVNATGATGDALNGLEQSIMKAYTSHNQDLDTTAGAIGEINTRMGLTGDELAEVTGLFLDYSRITGSDVVGSVQNVTKVMNQWGVEGENVESILDKLAYAGQISGISVDRLSQTLITGAASFQEVGLSLDSAIQLLADFELAGINSSVAITAMRTAVNNFTKDGLDAEQALQEVINKIATMEDSTEATALAVETFGKQAGQQLALSIRNGTISVDSFTATLDAADGTLRKTADAGETLGEKWEKSNNKIKSAFTSALQPTFDKISSGMANVMGKIGDFLDKHPVVTKAIIAIGAGLGVAAISIAGVTFAVTVAIPAITAFGTSIQAALGPIGWISLGATALVGGIMALTSAFDKSEDQVEDYNGTMEDCASEIERTQAAYDKACELYGENSAAARDLAENLETLNKQYEKGGGAAAVYAEKAESISKAMGELSSAQKKAMDEIDRTETSGMTAVAMLASLSDRANLTNKDLDLMSKYADYLNDEFDCDIKVNYKTKELTGFDPKVITDTIIQAAKNERVQTAMDYLSGADFQDNYISAKKNIREAYYELNRLNDLLNPATTSTTTTATVAVGQKDPYDNGDSKKSAKEIKAEIESIESAIAGYQDTIDKAESDIRTYGLLIDETGEFANSMMSAFEDASHATDTLTESQNEQVLAQKAEQEGIEAARMAASEFTDEILQLSEAYDEAYQSALDSFQKQFSLFDQASTQSETYLNSTVANAQAALESQLAYWTAYENNINVLKNTSADDLGITKANYDALMSYVQSGDEQAAGLAQSMVSKIQQGDTEAVAALANTLASVNSKQDEIAKTTADWSTGFSSEMDKIEQKMKDTVNGLDLSEDASKAATSTMNGYINQISGSAFRARNAAQSVVDAVKSVFDNANLSYTVDMKTSGTGVSGHAKGTTNAEDVFIAGEEGPELIVGKAGSTVFPTSETNKIISALGNVGESSSITDNSTINNVGPTYERYDNTERTEVINNSYKTVENVNTYDDSKVIYFLDKFVAICSAIEKNTSVQNKAADPSPSVSSHDESVTYGNTESIDNSRSYTTEYGDSISNISNLDNAYSEVDSRIYSDTVNYGDTSNSIVQTDYTSSSSADFVTNYGDSSQSIENSLRNGDRIYKADTDYDIDNALSNSADSVFSEMNDNIVEYGDMIRSYSDVVNYGDNVKKSDSSESTDTSKSWNSSYDSDNSRKYDTEIKYVDFVTDTNVDTDSVENSSLYQNVDTVESNDNCIISNIDTAKNYENALASYDNSRSAIATYDIDNALSNSADSVFGDVSSMNVENVIYNSSEKSDSYVAGDSYSSFVESPSYYDSSESYENALRGSSNNHSTIIAYNTQTSRSDYAGAVNGDAVSYDYNYGGKTIDFSGDSFKAYSSSESNSKSIYSNSSDSNSIFSSTTSNAESFIDEYGDSIRRYEQTIADSESASYADNSSAFGDTKNSTSSSFNSVENSYDSISESASTAFGGNIETVSTVNGDQVFNIIGGESSSDNSYSTDNVYNSFDNGDYSTAESSSSYVEYGDMSNDVVETATNYVDSISKVDQTYSPIENSSQMIENGITSIVFPAFENILKLIDNSFRSEMSESKEYYRESESLRTASTELSTADVVLEVPDLTIPETDDKPLSAEKSPMFVMPPEERQRENKEDDDKPDNNRKHIVLEIAGNGSIDIADGVDRRQVLEMLQDNLKPVLMNIIASEIYEEGDGSYDY